MIIEKANGGNQNQNKPKSKVLASLENELEMIITENKLNGDINGVKFGNTFFFFFFQNKGLKNYR